jgi:predicted MFS family arabinose efflux permease
MWGPRLAKIVVETKTEGKVDLPGSLLLGIALFSLLLPLTLYAKWGWNSLPPYALFGISILSAAALCVRTKNATEPLIDPKLLLNNPPFAYGNLAALLNYMAIFAVGLLASVWLQLALGFSAKTAGWIMLSQPAIQSALSPVAGRFSDNIGTSALTTAGMLLTARGMVLLAYLGSGSGLAGTVMALAVVGLGMALFSAPNSSAVMGSVARDQLGLASAFLAMMRATGMTLSVAILGGLAAGHLGAGGWQDLLERGPGGVGADAFIRGYKTAMLTGASLALIGAFACLVKQRAERV